MKLSFFLNHPTATKPAQFSLTYERQAAGKCNYKELGRKTAAATYNQKNLQRIIHPLLSVRPSTVWVVYIKTLVAFGIMFS